MESGDVDTTKAAIRQAVYLKYATSGQMAHVERPLLAVFRHALRELRSLHVFKQSAAN